MIKVGFITSVLNTGHAGRGIGVYTKNLFPYLKKYEKDYGITVSEINETGKGYGSQDLMHYPFFDLFFPTLPLIHPVKFVVTCHDVIPLEFPDHYPPGIKGNISLLLQTAALKNVSAVLTDSYASVKAIRKYLGVDHSRLKMIYLGSSSDMHRVTDPRKLAEVKKKYNLPDKFVLNVGDVNWNKNIPGLVKACIDLHLPLVLAGKQAALVEEMDDRHPELRHLAVLKSYFSSLKSDILCPGFIPDADLAALYTLAAVYCQPSFAEGFGLTVLEAMACGTPVACSRTHSLPEIAGDSAVYFDPADKDGISSALSKLMTDAGLRKSLSVSGPVQAGNFSWDKTARETLTVYRQVAKL